MPDRTLPRIEIDGRAATVESMWSAFGGYGHFTAMQVRDRTVRGVDLHLTRLEEGTRALFGAGLDGQRVRELIRHALADDIRDASVRVIVSGGDVAAVSVMVAVREPATMPNIPQVLRSVPYQRPFAHIKHLGGFGQAFYGRLVRGEGFDEALLVGPDGTVAEGSVTNIAFADGDTVLWPDAPALHGISMQVLERELDRAGIPRARRGDQRRRRRVVRRSLRHQFARYRPGRKDRRDRSLHGRGPRLGRRAAVRSRPLGSDLSRAAEGDLSSILTLQSWCRHETLSAGNGLEDGRKRPGTAGQRS
jgi:hypothetical protein